MNEQRTNLSYAAIIANSHRRRTPDPVQRTLDELEKSGRDLRNVTPDEFKTLLARTMRQQSVYTNHLVSC